MRDWRRAALERGYEEAELEALTNQARMAAMVGVFILCGLAWDHILWDRMWGDGTATMVGLAISVAYEVLGGILLLGLVLQILDHLALHAWRWLRERAGR